MSCTHEWVFGVHTDYNDGSAVNSYSCRLCGNIRNEYIPRRKVNYDEIVHQRDKAVAERNEMAKAVAQSLYTVANSWLLRTALRDLLVVSDLPDNHPVRVKALSVLNEGSE